MPQTAPPYLPPRHQHEDMADLFLSEHDIAALLPPDTSAISANGFMDNHRKPIISINGKDVTEHEGGV